MIKKFREGRRMDKLDTLAADIENLTIEQLKEMSMTEELKEKAVGPWKMMYRNFVRNKLAVVGVIIFVLIILFVFLGPAFSPYGRDEMNYMLSMKSPTWSHLLGTDKLGRDYMTRVMFGGRISILVGLLAAGISVIIGTIVGGLSGYYGGKIDNVLMRFAEIIYCFPFMPFAICLSAVFGVAVSPEARMYIIMGIIGILNWPSLARLIRGQVLSLKEEEFMVAAKALGIPDRTQIFKHLIPNTFGYIIVNATIAIAGAMLSEAGLSFLGLGIVPPTPSWGNMIQLASDAYTLEHYWWLWIPPGLSIFLSVMCVNLFGDGLRDAVDPKSIR